MLLDGGPVAGQTSEHAQAAHILAVVYVVFTAVLILAFAAYRISGGMPTGLGVLDGLFSSRGLFNGLRVLYS